MHWDVAPSCAYHGLLFGESSFHILRSCAVFHLNEFAEEEKFENFIQIQSFFQYQMIFECVGTIKSLSTLFTAVASLATMNQTMLVVNRAGEESLAADCAQEWSEKQTNE